MQVTRLDYWVILSLLIFKLLKLCWCNLGVTQRLVLRFGCLSS